MRLDNVLRLVKNFSKHRFGKCTICGKKTVFLLFSATDTQHVREQFHCFSCKSISRQRHVALEILRAFECEKRSIQEALQKLKTLKVYSASSGDPLYKILGEKNPNYVASEYFPDVPIGTQKNGVLCQNLEMLTFADSMFDLVVTEDVLEHVANFKKALSEIHRVLRQGGFHIFTVPLLLDKPTLERAVLENGVVKHLLPPEYHGDPIRGKILAYRTFGYDIFQILSEMGFESSLSATFFQTTVEHAIADSYVIVSRKR